MNTVAFPCKGNGAGDVIQRAGGAAGFGFVLRLCRHRARKADGLVGEATQAVAPASPRHLLAHWAGGGCHRGRLGDGLPDGLDGLAIVPIMIAAGCFGLISYLIGNVMYANYLHFDLVPGSGELAVFCSALIGAGLGFLWYNAPPAMVFMGDTGSLAFGGSLGVIAVIVKHEIVLAIIGGLFVVEALSVMIQVASFKMTGKRVFRMAPIHHHYEKLGWKEPTVVIRFWIVAVILGLRSHSTRPISNTDMHCAFVLPLQPAPTQRRFRRRALLLFARCVSRRRPRFLRTCLGR